MHEELQVLHPDDSWEVPAPLAQPPQQELFDFINRPWVCKQVRGSARGPSPTCHGVAVDMWGWDMKESWLPLIGDPQLTENLALVIFKPMARVFLQDEHQTLMVGGRQVPVSKWPKKGVRPLLCRQCLATAACQGASGGTEVRGPGLLPGKLPGAAVCVR